MKALSHFGLVACAIVASASPSLLAQSVPQLFVETTHARLTPPHAVPDSSNAQSDTTVGIRLDVLFGDSSGPARRIGLSHGDHEWVAALRRVDPPDVNGFRSWVGVIDGADYSHVVITERAGVVSGLMTTGSEAYQVRTLASGTFLLERVDVRASANHSVVPATPGPPEVARDVIASDDGTRIDVLIVYTEAAQTAAGGRNQIEATASQIISDTNTILSNSGVAPRLNLVATIPVTHDEYGSAPIDMPAISGLPAVTSARDQVGADIVHILLSNADVFNEGASYLLTNPAAADFDAFSAAKVNTLATFGPSSQMAFNFGAYYAPEDSAQTGVFPYSRAFKSPALGFRTLQALPCGFPDSCPRIPYLSNPAVQYLGATIGGLAQNNAATVNNIALTVANWRQQVGGGSGGGATPPAPTNLTSQVSGLDVRLSWDSSSAASYRLQVGSAPGLSDLFDGNVGNVVSLDATLGIGSYFWRVYAIGGNGMASPPSLESSFSVTTSCGAPTAPRNLAAAVNGGLALLSWDPPAIGSVGTYIVEAGSSAGITNLYNAPVGAAPIVQAYVPAGVYFVRVRANNVCGNSAPSNEVFFSVGSGGGATAQPQDLRVTLTTTLVTASWNLAAGSAIPDAFVIEAGSAPGLADQAVIEVNGQTLSFTTNRPASGSYYVRVRARNGTTLGPPTPDLLLVVP
jgi:hypothetical protein